VLWDRGPSTAAQITQAIQHPALAKTTVLTTLGILERKGQITHDIEGRTHVFRALVGEEAARRSVLDDLTKRFFGGSRRALLLHVLEAEAIGEAEARRIREILAKADRKEES
jgi:predicted transcriptional regulator